ncbi:MAG: hypothetical protein ACLFVU_01405, partial [Phycisphaerae bacterium]
PGRGERIEGGRRGAESTEVIHGERVVRHEQREPRELGFRSGALSLCISEFGFVSDFEIRISNLRMVATNSANDANLCWVIGDRGASKLR